MIVNFVFTSDIFNPGDEVHLFVRMVKLHHCPKVVINVDCGPKSFVFEIGCLAKMKPL
jgi:hypothetical protein